MIWLVPVAVGVGLLLGTLGGGGAILTVPILTGLLHLPLDQAVVGSLVVVGLSSLVGAMPHLRAGRVRVVDGLIFGLIGSGGAVLGSRLSLAVPGRVLTGAFVVLLLAVAVSMWRGRANTSLDAAERRGWGVRLGAATGVGLLTGFFGVGGGFVIVPALTLVLGMPVQVAVATSLVVIAVNSAISLAARFHAGLVVDWSVVIPFAIPVVLGALVGAQLSHRVDPLRLRKAFVVVLVLVAVYMGARALVGAP